MRYLSKLGSLESDKKVFKFTSKLSDASVVIRYPGDFEELQRTYEAQNDTTVRDLDKREELRNISDMTESGKSFKVNLKDT